MNLDSRGTGGNGGRGAGRAALGECLPLPRCKCCKLQLEGLLHFGCSACLLRHARSARECLRGVGGQGWRGTRRGSHGSLPALSPLSWVPRLLWPWALEKAGRGSLRVGRAVPQGAAEGGGPARVARLSLSRPCLRLPLPIPSFMQGEHPPSVSARLARNAPVRLQQQTQWLQQQTLLLDGALASLASRAFKLLCSSGSSPQKDIYRYP